MKLDFAGADRILEAYFCKCPIAQPSNFGAMVQALTLGSPISTHAEQHEPIETFEERKAVQNHRRIRRALAALPPVQLFVLTVWYDSRATTSALTTSIKAGTNAGKKQHLSDLISLAALTPTANIVAESNAHLPFMQCVQLARYDKKKRSKMDDEVGTLYRNAMSALITQLEKGTE